MGVGHVFQPPPHVAVTLVGRSSARQARRLVVDLLAGVTAQEWHADAALVVSELVANALEECGECQVAAWYERAADALRVEVMDRSAHAPVMQPADSARVSGYSLRIVDALSTRWGVDARRDSKVVWFEIDG